MRTAREASAHKALIEFHRRTKKRVGILSSALFPNKGYLIHYTLGKEESVAFVGLTGKSKCFVRFSTAGLGYAGSPNGLGGSLFESGDLK